MCCSKPLSCSWIPIKKFVNSSFLFSSGLCTSERTARISGIQSLLDSIIKSKCWCVELLPHDLRCYLHLLRCDHFAKDSAKKGLFSLCTEVLFENTRGSKSRKRFKSEQKASPEGGRQRRDEEEENEEQRHLRKSPSSCVRGTKRRRLDERKTRKKNPSLFAEVERWGGGGETEERRRHPCVLHLIRPPIEGYNFHKREGGRIYTREGSTLKSSHTHRVQVIYHQLMNLDWQTAPCLSHWSY